MNKQANKPLYLRSPLALGAAVLILVSGIAVASLAISGQAFSGTSVSAEPPVAAPVEAAPGARNTRCAECGVIESTRLIEDSADKHGVNASGRLAVCNRGGVGRNAARPREITVRLQDGSMRVITDAKPAKWKRGEAVTIIAGVI